MPTYSCSSFSVCDMNDVLSVFLSGYPGDDLKQCLHDFRVHQGALSL